MWNIRNVMPSRTEMIREISTDGHVSFIITSFSKEFIILRMPVLFLKATCWLGSDGFESTEEKAWQQVAGKLSGH